jgi:hypothetical protein
MWPSEQLWMWPPVRAVGFLLKHREQLCPMSVARKHSIFDNARRSLDPKTFGMDLHLQQRQRWWKKVRYLKHDLVPIFQRQQICSLSKRRAPVLIVNIYTLQRQIMFFSFFIALYLYMLVLFFLRRASRLCALGC